ncbi:MAG: insulinase family protein [Candidatus Kerfeldbacteria bacterium]|nr:insulinase family protein [Candidatus Kerfeldbacteria bacterium]
MRGQPVMSRQDQLPNHQFVQFVLPNGSQLVAVPDVHAHGVGIAVSLPGSRFEPKPLLGHVTEHLIADREPYPSYTQFAAEVDKRTTGFNAEIYREAMSFVFGTTVSDLPETIDFAYRVIVRSRFSERMLKREIPGLVVEEKLDDDTIDGMLADLVDETLFSGHILGQRLFGSRQEMFAISVADIRHWHQRIIHSPIAVAVYGNVDPTPVHRWVSRRFGRLPSRGPLDTPRFVSRQSKLRIRTIQWPTQLIHIAVATFLPFGLGHSHRLVLSALNNHLGEQKRWGNRLLIRLIGKDRSTDRLVYSADSNIWNNRDCGKLVATTQAEPDKVEEVLRRIVEEYDRLRSQPLTEQELAVAKKWMVSLSARRNQDPERHAQFLAEQALVVGRPLVHQSFVDAVERSVTAERIQRAARRYLRRDRTSVILVGPVKRLRPRAIRRALAAL